MGRLRASGQLLVRQNDRFFLINQRLQVLLHPFKVLPLTPEGDPFALFVADALPEPPLAPFAELDLASTILAGAHPTGALRRAGARADGAGRLGDGAGHCVAAQQAEALGFGTRGLGGAKRSV